ncbi:helix-turn-helix domain-containing protein [Huaxiibacter chinensis]
MSNANHTKTQLTNKTQCNQSNTSSYHLLTTEKEINIDDIMAPREALQRVFLLLEPYAAPYKGLTNRSVNNGQGKNRMLWLLTNGKASYYRYQDDLKVMNTSASFILGFPELFEPLGRYYFRATKGSLISCIPVEKAQEIFTENNAWQDISKILAYFLHLMVYRDEHLVSKNSYSIIRTKLVEYMQKKTTWDLMNTGIVSYIIESTHLSRSQVYNVIGALSEGGYIEVNNGRLTKINSLPKKF